MIVFNPERHEYRDGDQVIDSVTQILSASGLIDSTWYTDEARDMGSAVHKLCERYAAGERFGKGGILLASLEYVNAFAAWMLDYGVYAIATECRVYHRINGKPYAGTFDVLAEIAGRRELVDMKTGARAKWHPVQLAAYAMARPVDEFGHVGETSVNPDRCAVLYLRADGTYRYEPIPGGRLVEAIREFKEYL